MSSTAEILEDFRSRGFQIERRGADLFVAGGTLSASERQTLRANKAQILGLLDSRETSAESPWREFVAKHDRELDLWCRTLGREKSLVELVRWLAEVAPDLALKIGASEVEVLTAPDEATRAAALEKWRYRWWVARIGFEYFIGIRSDDP